MFSLPRLKKIISGSFLFLFLLPAFLHAESLREIKITAAVSTSFQKNPDWEKEIRDRMLFANRIFEKAFGIHFSLYRTLKWDPEDEKRETPLLLEEMHSVSPLGPDEIMIGFHKMTQLFGVDAMEDLDTVGTAEFFKGYVILRDPFQDMTSLQRQVTMVHEIGHLFGAIHISGENEIMRASLGREPLMTFDADNQAILQVTKRVDFQTGAASLSPAEIDQLIQIYEKLIRKNPHSDFYYQLGHFYKMRGLPARAVATWEEAVRYQYSNPLIHWELGRYYYENSRYDAAIQELGSAVAFFILPSQKAQRAMAFNFLGVAYYKKGNMDQALFNWLKGLSYDPDNIELQGNLAAAYMERGDLDRGISELLKLLAKYPDDQTTLSNLGVAYLKKKDYAKAAQYAQSALERLTYSQDQQREADAKKSAKKELLGGGAADPKKNQLMSSIPEALLRVDLGVAYMGMKDFDRAIPELKKARKLDPQNVAAIQNLSYAYLKKQEYEFAIDEAKAGVELDKENPNFYAFLAEAYAMTSKTKEALAAAKTGLLYAPVPLRANLRKNIAVLLSQNNLFQEAAVELKNSLTDNWNDADTHLKLGYVYAQMKRMEDSKRSFQNALRVDPNQAEAKKALADIFKK